MDPYGHLAPWLYKETMDKDDVEIRPTIAITRAHMKLPELEESVRKGRLVPDGKICVNETGEVAVTKVAVEPVWYLPGVAERFNIGMSPSNMHIMFPDLMRQTRELCAEHSSRRPVVLTPSLSLATISNFSFLPSAV
jgi:hypothetical protein